MWTLLIILSKEWIEKIKNNFKQNFNFKVQLDNINWNRSFYRGDNDDALINHDLIIALKSYPLNMNELQSNKY